MNNIKALVIGLGSMGKRRVRNLQALGLRHIAGFDPREDRREETSKQYGIPVFGTFEDAANGGHDVWIISTPPDIHHIYMKEALKHNKPSFIEASVVDTDMEEICAGAEQKNVFLAPSCTFFYHPGIKLIQQLLASGKIGKVTNVLYHAGQYLPDWHTYEPVSDYYVSKKETGGAREIVPFELTWLTRTFGFPQRVTAFCKKTIDIQGAADIDDTYNLLMDYPGMIVNLSVDVVSRYATRRILINGEEGQIEWSWDKNVVKLYSAETGEWSDVAFETAPAQSGYNKNITEQMYIDEMQSFLDAALTGAAYPNSLRDDHRILKVLYAAERSSETNQIQSI